MPVAQLLAWTRQLSLGEGALFSLVVNVAVFVAALALGDACVRLFGKSPVSAEPEPLTRAEVALATGCVVLNTLVMWLGWWLFRAGWLRVDADAAPLRLLGDLLVLTLVMDLLMYVTHRIAHHPFLYRWVHGVHHRYDRVRPLTLFTLHPLEVLGFGGLWIGVLLGHAFSLGGMLLYLTLNTTFGLLGHIGVEPVPKRMRAWPVVRHLGSSTFHARHHQTPHENYGFYTTVWDRLFGTLHPREAAGRERAST